MGSHTTRLPSRRLAVLTVGLLIGAGALISPLPAAALNTDTTRATSPAKGVDCQEVRNREVVLDALQAVFSEHRVDLIDQYFAEDFAQHSPYVPPGGREELKQWWSGMVYAMPDITTTVTQTVNKCADVVTFRTVQGTVVHDLPSLGIIGKGQHLAFLAADIFRVRNGKITDHWEVVDTGPLVMQALGG